MTLLHLHCNVYQLGDAFNTNVHISNTEWRLGQGFGSREADKDVKICICSLSPANDLICETNLLKGPPDRFPKLSQPHSRHCMVINGHTRRSMGATWGPNRAKSRWSRVSRPNKSNYILNRANNMNDGNHVGVCTVVIHRRGTTTDATHKEQLQVLLIKIKFAEDRHIL